MGTYLVRHKETKEIQGIFWGTKAEIWDTMDELGDPADCEYAPLSHGALYTALQYGKGLRYPQADKGEINDETTDFDWSQFSISERFWEEIAVQTKLKWKSFDFANEGVGLIKRIRDEREKKIASLKGLPPSQKSNQG